MKKTTEKKGQHPRKAPQKDAALRPSKSKKSSPRPNAAPDDTRPNCTFPIVAIGASAGGLEAFESFFSAMPSNSDAAFVLVSHLAPNHESILPALIQRKTAMQVNQVVDNMKVVPGQIYIIPPNREMAILNDTLHLLEMPKSNRANLPIDIFFRSLAQDKGNMGTGIILSGTGTDGTLGIRAIKGEGGMIMAQDPESAKYDGMPSSAIATGMVDYILPPDRMPDQIFNYIRKLRCTLQGQQAAGGNIMEADLLKIFVLLRTATRHDFSHYKKNTLYRRIERRMNVQQVDTIEEYIRYLRESELEISILFKELLIGVTSFFRDPEAFAALKEKILALLKNKADDDQMRIWVPGCSSGEEAYSIAIVVQECLKETGRHLPVQIFGTDLDDEAVNRARAGIYPESICADVSQERLRTFFTRDENHYRIHKTIREMVVFALQNITKDPPFTKLDLLSCRNLLIYFDQELQQILLPVFHHSLRTDGLLFLGSSETIGQATDLFTPLDKKWKIFRHRPSGKTSHLLLAFPAAPTAPHLFRKTPPQHVKPVNDMDPFKLLKTMIAQSDMSTCVVIDDHGTIIYIHGRTGCFLEPAEGEATLNIREMARHGLKAGLNKAIQKMATERREIIEKGLRVTDSCGHAVQINLIIRPLPDMQTGRRGLMMIIFEEIPLSDKKDQDKSAKARPAVRNAELKNLEDELQYTRENLQTTIEELETANEELKSTNEELQSTNEELQSSNEELETSKEELQSMNDESSSVNSELQGRIEELVTANDDMKNLLDATDIATVFLDIKLNIRRFTPRVTELIPLTAMDTGRPISHFATRLKNVDLAEHAQKVLQDLGTREIEVEGAAGAIYRMRLRPYRTTNNVIDGVVILFDDITELKQLTQAKRLVAVVNDSNDAVILLDTETIIQTWNKGAEKIYGYSEAEAVKMNFFDLIPSALHDENRKMFALIKEKKNIDSFVSRRLRKDGTTFNVWLTATRLSERDKEIFTIAVTERDLATLSAEALKMLTGGTHHDGQQ